LLERIGISTTLQSAVPIGEMVAPYERVSAIKDLRDKKVVILVGGLGNPFFTTDTAASLRALEIGVEIILKATKVEGVYDSDPLKNPSAVKFDYIPYEEVLQRNLRVIDSTAIALCMEHKLSLVVFNVGVRGNMKKIILGEKEGTFIGG